MVSHTLRTPLSGALGGLQLLPDLAKSSEEYEETIEATWHSVIKLDHIVREMNVLLSVKHLNSSPSVKN